jgi:hypothetical protein
MSGSSHLGLSYNISVGICKVHGGFNENGGISIHEIYRDLHPSWCIHQRKPYVGICIAYISASTKMSGSTFMRYVGMAWSPTCWDQDESSKHISGSAFLRYVGMRRHRHPHVAIGINPPRKYRDHPYLRHVGMAWSPTCRDLHQLFKQLSGSAYLRYVGMRRHRYPHVGIGINPPRKYRDQLI